MLNNPFFYQPDPLCRRAMGELQAWLGGVAPSPFAPVPPTEDFRREIAQGKMFGVLVVEQQKGLANGKAEENETVADKAWENGCGPADKGARVGYVAGFSGQIGGCADWPGFVPAVFDYLQDDGYFKQEEARIVEMSQRIAHLQEAMDDKREARESADATGSDPRPTATKDRKEDETEENYIRRRQYENAELHRWKLRQRARQDAANAVSENEKRQLEALKSLRRKRSDALQTWLFRQFRMLNGRGEERDLVEIAHDYNATVPLPPAGSGECCEPRMLQWALRHGLRPVSMAMFWWGESPRGEVRHHLQTYPACQGKCKPILKWMLRGLPVMPNPLEQASHHKLGIVYEDADLCVVNKPAGMLSVAGKSRRESVQSVVEGWWPQAEGPFVVHRLDMDTSGLMVLAKNRTTFLALQQQFLRHEVRKRYVARLTRDVATASGDIALPLRPDLNDRPRQMVDPVLGKPAETHWERIGERMVALYPRTGRTHQLRLHCAHRDGLDNPILGDALYGTPADRLHLHAQQLSFRHPHSLQPLTFSLPYDDI